MVTRGRTRAATLDLSKLPLLGATSALDRFGNVRSADMRRWANRRLASSTLFPRLSRPSSCTRPLLPDSATPAPHLGYSSRRDAVEIRFNGVNAFHQMGSWNLLVLAFALCTSLAVAQEGQQVPKTTPAGPATTPGAAQGKGSGWVKLCSKNEQTGNKQLCLVKYEELDPNTGLRQIIVAARSGEGEDKQTLLLGVTTAYTLIMPAGVQIKIDDGEPISLQYDLCFPTSCQGELELTKDMFEKMRKGKLMVVAAMNMQQKALAFPVPLTDFGKTFDGPRADNAKYEEAQRQMMETIRQRQIDLAKRSPTRRKCKGGNSPKPERRRLARRSRLSHRHGKLPYTSTVSFGWHHLTSSAVT